MRAKHQETPIPLPGQEGNLLAHAPILIAIDEREYARLLGYPWGKPLEGDVRERAEQAIDWYRHQGKPRVYCRTLETETVAAVTAGSEVDEEVERLWQSGHVDEAYFLDRFAAAVVEKLAADLGPCRSPGTAGIPFEEQWKLFSYLAPLAPQIEMLPSGMLKPKNSLLGVVSPDAQFRGNPCCDCDLHGCTFRRKTA